MYFVWSNGGTHAIWYGIAASSYGTKGKDTSNRCSSYGVMASWYGFKGE